MVSLAGTNTLQATAVPGCSAGNVNSHFFIFVPLVSTLPGFPLGFSTTPGVISIQFQTEAGHSYTVQYTDSLSPASWQTLTTITGDGTVKTATDTPSGSRRFYRVEAQ